MPLKQNAIFEIRVTALALIPKQPILVIRYIHMNSLQIRIAVLGLIREANVVGVDLSPAAIPFVKK